VGSLAGPKPQENHHPAPSPSCTHPASPRVTSRPHGNRRDWTYITVESGRVVGRSLQLHVTMAGWSRGVAARDLCFSGGRWVGSRASGAGVRPGPGQVREVAVQGGTPQSRQASMPRAGWRQLLLRALAGSSSVALRGAGHAASPRHFIVCLGSWAPWRLCGRQPEDHVSPCHPEAEPVS